MNTTQTLPTTARRPDNGADCLQAALAGARELPLRARMAAFSGLLRDTVPERARLYRRTVVSATGREVRVQDDPARPPRTMIMFGSNNYLGLANHPYVRDAVRRAVDRWGVGVAGPPHLNGTLRLHRELEARLAALKRQEDAVVFPTGYGANLGLVSALVRRGDRVVHDEKHHASFIDGLRLAGAASRVFPHNDVAALGDLLDQPSTGDTLVGVEGVYSMDGDLAPLAAIATACRKSGALLVVDDAHGTGVLGPGGSGAAAHAGVEHLVDAIMGTFSKTFSVVGGFVAGDHALVDWLRFYARSYMFSASLPPTVIAAVLAGLDVLERDPEPLERLWANVACLRDRLATIGIDWKGESPICSIPVPSSVDVHAAAARFHEVGLFINAIVYPAVPTGQERFRISLNAEHTAADIDRLVGTLATILEG